VFAGVWRHLLYLLLFGFGSGDDSGEGWTYRPLPSRSVVVIKGAAVRRSTQMSGAGFGYLDSAV